MKWRALSKFLILMQCERADQNDAKSIGCHKPFFLRTAACRHRRNGGPPRVSSPIRSRVRVGARQVEVSPIMSEMAAA
jgi:hypothetical protein